jgi:hypothetical protein
MRTLRTIIVVLLLTGHGLVWAGWDEADAALRQGDLATSTQALHALAEQGDVSAQSHLGVRYANGLGVPRDLTEALKWFRKAAEQGNAVAQSRLGNMYANGVGGLPQDHKEAARWLRKAAEQGHDVAQSKLGVMYARGRGVPQDFVQAHKWFIIAGHTDDVLPRRMTSAQIAEAQKLAREWMEAHQVNYVLPQDKDTRSFGERLLEEVNRNPGLSDRELTEIILGKGKHQSQVNQEARLLERQGRLIRRVRQDGVQGNYPAGQASASKEITAKPVIKRTPERLSEDELKEYLETWLAATGWSTHVAWGQSQGFDIIAEKDGARWMIEVKGLGSWQQVRVNNFTAILGETLQRMDTPEAKYSIALPDIPQFRGLWERLPDLAKQRTMINALFVSGGGDIEEAE